MNYLGMHLLRLVCSNEQCSKFCRFAILSGPTIPIIGEGDEEANDRYFTIDTWNNIKVSEMLPISSHDMSSNLILLFSACSFLSLS